MKDPIRVEKNQRLENLIQKALSLRGGQRSSDLLHVFFEIVLQILEHKIELVLLEQNLLQLNHVWMLQVFQK